MSTTLQSTIIGLGVATLLGLQPVSASGGQGDWQLKQLHQPSPGLVKAELRGRVTIYDGVHSAEVHKAMDEQFERIDNMMFIRTRHDTEHGEVVEDDDCD